MLTHMAVPRATWVPAARTPSWRQYFLARPLPRSSGLPTSPSPVPSGGHSLECSGLFLFPVSFSCLLSLNPGELWRSLCPCPAHTPDRRGSWPPRLSLLPEPRLLSSHCRPLTPVTLPHHIHVFTPRCLPPVSTNPRNLSVNAVDHCIPWPLVSGNFHFP